MKSLNLDKKQIKVLQKRLCNNVGRIKSYLSAEDIAFMRTLEMEGRFKPDYNSVYVSHFMTILAAEKRLKLKSNDEIKQMTEADLKEEVQDLLADTSRSDEPVDQHNGDHHSNSQSHQQPTENHNHGGRLHVGRSRSAVSKASRQRQPQATVVTEDIAPLRVRNTSARTCVSYRESGRSMSLPPDVRRSSNTTPRPTPTAASRNNLTKLPSTLPGKSPGDVVDGFTPISRASSESSGLDEAATFFRPKSSISRASRAGSKADQSQTPSRSVQTARDGRPPVPRPMTTGGFLSARKQSSNTSPGRPRTTLGVESKSLNYSSHKAISLKQSSNSGKENGHQRGRRISVMSSSSLGSEMAKEKATEKRRELLSNEQTISDNIEEKRQVFLSRISKWVEENPSIISHEKPKYAFIDSSDMEHLRNNAKTKVIENEGLYDKLDEDAWKDLKKCRYLRLQDDKLDLSGINTLARDQMHMFGNFRIDYSNTKRGTNADPVTV